MSITTVRGIFAPSELLQALRERVWPPKDMHPSFSGQKVLITGSNTGLGLEAAIKFVARGADQVILGVRDLDKGEIAKRKIELQTGRKDIVQVWQIEMLDYDSIINFATRAGKELDHLDISVLNAGVTMASYETSKYGWEKTMQINVISTTLLALLLLPKMKASNTKETGVPVLELVGSSSHYNVRALASASSDGKITNGPFELRNDPDSFHPFKTYAISKLFLQYVQLALIKLVGTPPQVHIVTVCPGATKSQLGRGHGKWYARAFLGLYSGIFMKSTEEGARICISAITLGERGHGRFWRKDIVDDPGPMLKGKEYQQIQRKVWEEIVEALRKDVPQVDGLIKPLECSGECASGEDPGLDDSRLDNQQANNTAEQG